jgi:hypothetical protein
LISLLESGAEVLVSTLCTLVPYWRAVALYGAF